MQRCVQRMGVSAGLSQPAWCAFSSMVGCCCRAGLKSMLLEKRVSVLSEALEMKDAQLGEVLAAAHLDPATLQQVRAAARIVSVMCHSLSLHGCVGARHVCRQQ